MKKHKTIWVLLIIFFALFLSGCSDIYIYNLSEITVRVSVNTPDAGSPSTRAIPGTETKSVFSSNGGRYTVTVLPDEEYRALLNNLQQVITQQLFNEGATLSAEDVAELTERINQIDQMLEDEQNDYGASCTGYVPDYETVTVYVNWDATSSQFVVECGSGSGN